MDLLKLLQMVNFIDVQLFQHTQTRRDSEVSAPSLHTYTHKKEIRNDIGPSSLGLILAH